MIYRMADGRWQIDTASCESGLAFTFRLLTWHFPDDEGAKHGLGEEEAVGDPS